MATGYNGTDQPDPSIAKKVEKMPLISNPHSRQTLEALGPFDYNKYAGTQDYSQYLDMGPMELDEGSYYDGQWY